MARGFLARREAEGGQVEERPYELLIDRIELLTNRGIRIPFNRSDDPIALIEAHERRMWPHSQGKLTIIEFESLSGTFFPSIARPLGMHDGSMVNPRAADENETAKNYLREHYSIADDIEGCFNVVSPHIDNYCAFGTQFEKIIYFSCVGIESLFNKILSDNGRGIKSAKMSDFVCLKPLLRIDEYTLSFLHYPWLPKVRPFCNWDSKAPSKSLDWFDAYNSLKHDKQNSASRATMKNALHAAAGHYLLTFAVFGDKMFSGYIGERFFFQFAEKPSWSVGERYFTPFDEIWKSRSPFC